MSVLTLATFLGIHSIGDVGQAAVTGIINGGSYALLGMGFALILGVTGRLHFAYGIVYTFTAYIAALAVGPWGLALVPAVMLGLVVGMALGVGCEALVYRPLAARAGENVLLGVFVASLGLVIAGENLIPELWGSNTRPIPGFPDHAYHPGNIIFTRSQVTLVILAIVIAVVMTLVLNRTILGQQIKAVTANSDMAEAVGVNVKQIFMIVFALGSLMAGVAALFSGMLYGVIPTIGETPLFYAFVIAYVAGVTRSPAVVAGVGFLIGVIESLSTLWVSQTESSITVFGLLFLWLAVRVLPAAARELRGALGGRGMPAPSVQIRKAA
jgi:branched-subunit amino acid ABC-type transport system permease component